MHDKRGCDSCWFMQYRFSRYGKLALQVPTFQTQTLLQSIGRLHRLQAGGSELSHRLRFRLQQVRHGCVCVHRIKCNGFYVSCLQAQRKNMFEIHQITYTRHDFDLQCKISITAYQLVYLVQFVDWQQTRKRPCTPLLGGMEVLTLQRRRLCAFQFLHSLAASWWWCIVDKLILLASVQEASLDACLLGSQSSCQATSFLLRSELY